MTWLVVCFQCTLGYVRAGQSRLSRLSHVHVWHVCCDWARHRLFAFCLSGTMKASLEMKDELRKLIAPLSCANDDILLLALSDSTGIRRETYMFLYCQLFRFKMSIPEYPEKVSTLFFRMSDDISR